MSETSRNAMKRPSKQHELNLMSCATQHDICRCKVRESLADSWCRAVLQSSIRFVQTPPQKSNKFRHAAQSLASNHHRGCTSTDCCATTLPKAPRSVTQHKHGTTCQLARNRCQHPQTTPRLTLPER